MGPLEYRYTRFCSTEGDAYDGYYDTSHPRCIPDLLWWARPLPLASANDDSDDEGETDVVFPHTEADVAFSSPG